MPNVVEPSCNPENSGAEWPCNANVGNVVTSGCGAGAPGGWALTPFPAVIPSYVHRNEYT